MPKKEPLYPHVPKSRQTRVIPIEPRRPREREEIEFLPDSPEVLTQTITATGYRSQIDNAFQQAINRAKGPRKW